MVRALVTVPATADQDEGELESIYNRIVSKGFPGIVGAALVYGDIRMILTAEVRDLPELDQVVLKGLRQELGLRLTRTYIIAQSHNF